MLVKSGNTTEVNSSASFEISSESLQENGAIPGLVVYTWCLTVQTCKRCLKEMGALHIIPFLF